MSKWWVKYKITGHGDWWIYRGPFGTRDKARIESKGIGSLTGTHSVSVTSKQPPETAKK